MELRRWVNTSHSQRLPYAPDPSRPLRGDGSCVPTDKLTQLQSARPNSIGWEVTSARIPGDLSALLQHNHIHGNTTGRPRWRAHGRLQERGAAGQIALRRHGHARKPRSRGASALLGTAFQSVVSLKPRACSRAVSACSICGPTDMEVMASANAEELRASIALTYCWTPWVNVFNPSK